MSVWNRYLASEDVVRAAQELAPGHICPPGRFDLLGQGLAARACALPPPPAVRVYVADPEVRAVPAPECLP